MFFYLSFDAVALSCGTCSESMKAMESGKVFGAPVVDAAAGGSEWAEEFRRLAGEAEFITF